MSTHTARSRKHDFDVLNAIVYKLLFRFPLCQIKVPVYDI